MYLSPFTEPPLPEVLSAVSEITLPAHFRGRAGLLLARSTTSGRCRLFSSTAPYPDWRDVNDPKSPVEAYFPELARADVPMVTLTNGHGEQKTLGALLEDLFAAYPDKPLDQGGQTIEQRRRRWRWALADGIHNPTVFLLNAFNRLNARTPGQSYELVGTAEWWVGEAPAHEVKHAGTLIPPPSTTRPLISFLTDGIPHEVTRPIVSMAPAIPILYEDGDVIVINKPARLASVPGVRETLSAKSILERQHGLLRVVHRLDMDTSGILVFAKTAEAEKAMHASFRQGCALKRYVARLEGVPPSRSGTISLPLGVNLLDPPRQCVLPTTAGGKVSITDWELFDIQTMPNGRQKALVNLWPATGRTHQLRIHCAHRQGLGLPIDGDSFYGSGGLLAESGRTRLCLHAAALTFDHPSTGEVLHFECEPAFPLF